MSWLGSECSPHKRRIDEVEPAPAHGEKKHEYAGNGSLVGSDRHPFDPHAGRRGAVFPRLRSLTARCRAGWPDGRSKRPTRRDDVALNLAFIPATFNTPHNADFDTAYMQKLFELGYSMAEAGYSWYKEPPVLLSHDDEASPAPR
jgi:hypothetical protein